MKNWGAIFIVVAIVALLNWLWSSGLVSNDGDLSGAGFATPLR